MSITTPVERGCGSRVEGGAYMVCGLSKNGRPLEEFIVDPPIIIDPTELGVSPVGVTFVERNGVTHVLDWVGGDSYPNVCDFYEEGKRFGFSRRIAKTVEFDRLTPESRMLLIHSRAHIENATDFYANIEGWRRWCPKHIEEHTKREYEGMCASLWWDDIEGGEPPEIDRSCLRKMPSFTYDGCVRPDAVTPQYKPAIFLTLPIHGIEIVRDRSDGSHVNTEERARASSLPVMVVEE